MQVMNKPWLFIVLAIVGSGMFIPSYAAPGQVVSVSASLVNNTSLPWVDPTYRSNNFSISISDTAISQSLNIDDYKAPVVGRYIAILPVNSSAIVELYYINTYGIREKNLLCQVKIEAISQDHAVMTQISQNMSWPYQCVFSGSPDDNSAQIMITNNS